MNQHPCNTPAELAQRLAAWIGLRLHQAIDGRGHAVLAVSGGKSPVPLFEALRAQPLEWSRVSITLVDERCVPHDHADSNTALVLAHLMQGAAAAATFVPWFDEAVPVNRLTLDASCPLSGQPDLTCAVRVERLPAGSAT